MLPDWFLFTVIAYLVISLVYRTVELADLKEWTRIKSLDSYWYRLRTQTEIGYMRAQRQPDTSQETGAALEPKSAGASPQTE